MKITTTITPTKGEKMKAKFYFKRTGLVHYTEKWVVEAKTKEEAENLMYEGDAQCICISEEVGDWDQDAGTDELVDENGVTVAEERAMHPTSLGAILDAQARLDDERPARVEEK